MIALNKWLDIMANHTMVSYIGFINSYGILGRRKKKERNNIWQYVRKEKKEKKFIL